MKKGRERILDHLEAIYGYPAEATNVIFSDPEAFFKGEEFLKKFCLIVRTDEETLVMPVTERFLDHADPIVVLAYVASRIEYEQAQRDLDEAREEHRT